MVNSIREDYFDWMYEILCKNRFSRDISYRKLFSYLFDKEFTYTIPRDANRASDGEQLRYRYSSDKGYDNVPFSLYEQCSVLEMLLALAIRCEETIMDNPRMGDRTGQWFWEMIGNLGLGSMNDDEFDIDKAEYIVDRFLERRYSPNGKGGLFTIRNCDSDLREVEIWVQLLWYLDEIS